MKVQSSTNKLITPIATSEQKSSEPKQVQAIMPVDGGREVAPAGPEAKGKPNSQGNPNPHQQAPAQTLLDEAVERMNQAVQAFERSLEFEVSKENRIVIKVIDKSSGEIIRQIPPEEFMDIFKRMDDTLGLLIDRRA
ncbi:MAG: flaG [Symbiobacteriaceae bacterium]|jgi:flagellar protein FlaG|nr:flaG [Symbiobacteriaceae bacterium]